MLAIFQKRILLILLFTQLCALCRSQNPLVTISNIVADANANGTVQPNEILTYTISGVNSGPGVSYSTMLVDSLSSNVTYVANSLIINYAPGSVNASIQTDASDNDLAFTAVSGTRRYIKFFFGVAANSSAGGTINPSGTYSISFKVKAAGIPSGIFNTARIYSTDQSGNLYTNDATAIISPPPSAAPVDVKLTVFNVVLINNNTGLLKWTTENEVNNDRFEIQRSEDGINFIKRGQVKGFGNTSTAHDYSFADPVNTNASVVYYRLKTINLDGNYIYTKIVALRLRGKVEDFTVYPNPFTDNMKVLVNVETDATSAFRIISLDGKEIMNQKVALQKGNNVVVLKDQPDMACGIYLLEVNTGTEKLVQKVIKQ